MKTATERQAAVQGFLIACIVAVAAAARAADPSPDIFGTWIRGGADPAEVKQRCPWVKGSFVRFPWSDLEPEPGRYDWAMFDKTLARYADAGMVIQFMVWVGPDSPRWIYENGVPEVRTTETLNPRGKPHKWTYPFYLDKNYEQFFLRLIRAVAERVDTLPPRVRRMIVAIQTGEGCTGDEGGYKGEPLDKRYALPERQWNEFKYRAWFLWESLYRDKQPKIHLLINSGNHGQYNGWILQHMPETWRKAGNAGHGYQLNGERQLMALLDPIINHPNALGGFVRCRSEMDETFKGWFREAPVWNQYWLNVWGLHFGLDIFQHDVSALKDPRQHEGFAFFSKYAGHKDPAAAPGAFCALRDGLDAADTKRFPPETFGKGTFAQEEAGTKRCLDIAAAFEKFGARQGDPKAAMASIMKNRDAQAMNDVGWNIEAGNYQRYLTQFDPNDTSQGYWRVGPKDQPYGRFARGFDAAAGRNAMYFDLDDRFFPGNPGAGPRCVRVRVVYFDQGKGSWALQYDAASGAGKTALAVTNTDTGCWKEVQADIADGRFENRCPHGTDFLLVNTSRENALFHMLEVMRK
jgi:hypothetical protein